MVELDKSSPSQDDRNLAMLAHLLGIFTSFVGPLIIWMIKKDDSRYVAQEAKEALNFQITMAIAYFAASVLIIVVIGVFLLWLLAVANFVMCILGAIGASKGDGYRYPVAIRLVS